MPSPFPRIAAAIVLHARKVLLAAGVLVFGILTIHWLPARQVRLHQQHFLTAVENRDWPRVRAFVAPDYRDPWNPDRAALLAQLPTAFRDFLACGILADAPTIGRQEDTLVFRARIRVVGSGGPIAQFLMQQSEALAQPFDFIWRRQSWRPWDWQLVRVDQPELAASAGRFESAIP